MRKTVLIRNVDGDTYRQARSLAVGKGLNMGDVITKLLKQFVDGEIEVAREIQKPIKRK